MKRRVFFVVLGLILAGFAFFKLYYRTSPSSDYDFAEGETTDIAALVKERPSDALPPNVIIMLADDLGYGEVQGYNPSTLLQTPFLTRLQQEGMKFTNFYSGEAVCAPARWCGRRGLWQAAAGDS